ncbi:MAG: sigma 54-interacting transcriptional regulator [Thermoanaerobaculia bacterium]|nr:sigma 54-interacting transcriptional regulator [Thermoanaerobaculia bacterium]
MPSLHPNELTMLLDLSEALGSPLNLRASFARALEILETDLKAVFGMITSLDAATGGLNVEAVTGRHGAAAEKTRYRLGEGITGRVVKTGKPIAVPRASQEPLFLDQLGFLQSRRKSKDDLSYVSVPIRVDGSNAGALGVAFVYEKNRDLGHLVKVLGIAASLLGQATRVHRLLQAERDRLMEENRQLKEELRERYDVGNLIGTSHPMQKLYEQVAQAAPANTTVLIRGESGTGKELVAHAIHYNSPRSGKPFVKVNCAALPESLIESELFGYEPGAFTGADKQKKGRFELAQGGTIFLDEVGDLPAATQIKLLRVLQEREFERLGGIKPVRVDVRLITATNIDLEEALKKGAFREDLYYRLNVFGLFVPPLRERRSDILLLADHFVEKYAAAHARSVRRISTSAIDMLMSYHWPGNVRELENCIERAVLICEGGVIHAHHLPPTLQTAEVSNTLPGQSLAASMSGFEKDLILDGLKIARGNRAKAARLLRTTERILNYKVTKHGIDPDRFRP